MRFFDFFSGIGGFRLGMEMAGHECVGHCEIDKFANMSYMAMHKPKDTEVYFGDIRTVDPWDMPECEIYCGGFPCQSFSIAGKRLGFEDTRGTLFFEIMRIAKERHPRYLFLENVKGLLNHDGGVRSRQSSEQWMSWGMVWNGKCLTADTSESHRIERGSSLSDILEESVDEKYFLSQKAIDRLMSYKDTTIYPTL